MEHKRRELNDFNNNRYLSQKISPALRKESVQCVPGAWWVSGATQIFFQIDRSL